MILPLLLASLLSAPVCNPNQLSFTASGGVKRPVCDKLSDVVSVKDLASAKGDGTTDDSAAFTTACALQAGKALRVPAGNYRIAANISCAADLYFAVDAKLAPDTGKTFTANGHVFALGANPNNGLGSVVYGATANMISTSDGFSFGQTVFAGSDAFFNIRRDVQGSTGIIIENQDTVGALTDSYIHLYGGPLVGINQGANLRLSAGALQNNGGLVNLVAENDASFNLIQQAAAPFDIYTANVKQFEVASVPNAVNIWQFKGGLVGSSISLAPSGSDTNTSIVFNTKGTGSHFFRTGATPAFQLEVKDTAGATNRLTITGGTNPTIGTSGGNLALTATSNIVSAPSLSVTSTTGGGTITLSTGSGTATVNSGARCVCTDTTANASVKCAVSTTTLTATGTGTDVIAYLCF